MSSQSLACPQCQTQLVTHRPVPADQVVRCPQCGTHFAADASATQAPARKAAASPELLVFAVALVVAFLALGGGVGAVLFFTRSQAVDRQYAAEREHLEAERAALALEREKINADKQKLELADLLHKGDDALAKKDYTAAAKLYDAALTLVPDDAAAKKGLILANTALAVDDKSAEDKAERQAKYTKLLDQGKKALADKEWADAVRAFESAVQVVPGDEAANKGLSDARAELAALQNDKAKTADYLVRMDAGRDALKAQRYPDAVREFLAALRLVPNDDAANKALLDAEKKIGDLQDRDKRKVDFDRLVVRAKASFREKRFDDALDSVQAALKLFPADKEAAALLADTRKARTDARTEYVRLLDQGTVALREGRFESAVRLFTEAKTLFPDDSAAKNGLRDAQRALDDATAFVRLRDQAATAFEAQRYAESLQFYNQALPYAPNDADVLLQLRRLRKLMERDVADAVEFDHQMEIGKAAYDRKDYTTASAAFKKAVQLARANLAAIDALRRSNYAGDMVAARSASSVKRYADAIPYYEAALQESPNDRDATTELALVRSLAKTTVAPKKDDKSTPPKTMPK